MSVPIIHENAGIKIFTEIFRFHFHIFKPIHESIVINFKATGSDSFFALKKVNYFMVFKKRTTTKNL